jgi:hypothetical protein
MKFIKPYKIFESSQPYNYSYFGKEGAQYIYYFNDELGNEFRVEFDHLPQNESEVRYLVKDDDKWSFKEISTNIFRITETIFGQIVPDFIQKNDWCQSIIVKGLASSKEKEETTRRTKVYWRYLQNNPIKGWSIDRYINEIYLDRN